MLAGGARRAGQARRSPVKSAAPGLISWNVVAGLRALPRLVGSFARGLPRHTETGDEMLSRGITGRPGQADPAAELSADLGWAAARGSRSDQSRGEGSRDRGRMQASIRRWRGARRAGHGTGAGAGAGCGEARRGRGYREMRLCRSGGVVLTGGGLCWFRAAGCGCELEQGSGDDIRRPRDGNFLMASSHLAEVGVSRGLAESALRHPCRPRKARSPVVPALIS